MKIRFSVVFSLMAVLALVSFGAADDVSNASKSMISDDTANEVIESGLSENTAIASEGNRSSEMNVEGIWRLSLEEMDITMALNQSNDAIFGQAKNEADNPWNGVAAGRLSGNGSFISLSAMVGEVLVSTFLEGNADGDIIKGNYIQSDGVTKYSSGEFTAIMISPDVSAYEPATIELPIDNAQQREAVKDDATNEKPIEPVAESAKSRFKSVTDLAKGINPNIMPNMAPI